MNDKDRKRFLKIIKVAAENIHYEIEYKRGKTYTKELYNMCLQETKEHENWMGGIKGPRVITMREEANFFMVKRIVEALNSLHPPNVDAYIHMKKSAFLAWSIAAYYKPELTGALIGIDQNEIQKMDYVTLVNNDETKKAA